MPHLAISSYNNKQMFYSQELPIFSATKCG